MKIVFDAYGSAEPIPVQRFVKNRKLVKYFNRETAGALVAVGKLFAGRVPGTATPFYYETGVMEYESIGLEAIAAGSVDASGRFDPERFVNVGIKAVPPLTQFKALCNMPLSFVAIEYGLCGDNAVVYASARGLMQQALCAPDFPEILLGCGKVHSDASVESAFALLPATEIEAASRLLDAIDHDAEAIELFRAWNSVYGAEA